MSAVFALFSPKRWVLFLGLACFLMTAIPAMPVQAQACICCKKCGVCCGDGAIKGAAETAAKALGASQQVAQWVADFASWAKKFAFLAKIIVLFQDFDRLLNDKFTQLGALINGGQAAQVEAKIRLTQGLADSVAETEAAESVALVAGALTPPTNDNQVLCNVVSSRQSGDSAVWWQRSLGGKIASMILDRARGKGSPDVQYAAAEDTGVLKAGLGDMNRCKECNGDGPQYAADVWKLRCDGVSGVKTANPLDGFPARCIPADKRTIDADLSAWVLDGTNALQMPSLVKKTSFGVAVNVPVPKTFEQQLYAAAVNFCAFLIGPRSSPPHGEDLKSPEGIVQTAEFDRSMALTSTFLTQCTNRIAYLTRPNCDDPLQYADPSVKKMCDTGNKACKAYVANNGTLPPDIDPAGTNKCPNGLSPYQMEWISRMMCKTNQYYTGATGAGEKHGALMNYATKCDLGVAEWESKRAKENLAFVDAVNGLMRMSGAFSGRISDKTSRISAPPVAPTPRPRHDASNKGGDGLVRKVAIKEPQAGERGATP